jgi:cytochrome c peroxidase
MMKKYNFYFLFSLLTLSCSQAIAGEYVFEAGHASLKDWTLGEVPHPKNNKPNPDRVALGKMLFFEPRLSRDGNMSCATCHSPLFGWSDGLPTAKGFQSQVLGRASPTIINTAYNSLQMWDGRKKTLEDQAMGPMQANVEMNMDIPKMMNWLRNDATYSAMFSKAYPDEKIDELTVSKSIASFERTVVSKNSPFDAWVNGNKTAMTEQQVRGFALFVDKNKGNCAACHSGGNFTDNSFHNIGLESFGDENPDLGRYAEKPIKVLKGAFKTPTIRDITYTAPYFHDGSSATLEEVVEHYVKGGVVTPNLSRSMTKLDLTQQEKSDLVEFMKALSSPQQAFTLPILP